MCGNVSNLEEETLTSLRTLSCGCRPQKELSTELRSRWKRASQSVMKARKDAGKRRGDKKWSAAMERALRAFQPNCVLCGVTASHTDHVRPSCMGHGLEPGNAVRLCGSCNPSKSYFELDQLPAQIAESLRSAAAQFKDYWESGCRTSPSSASSPSQTTNRVDSPVDMANGSYSPLIELLSAMECGDGTAISTLADWLEVRSDPRANAIRQVTTLQVVVRETRTIRNEVLHWVEVLLNGKNCDSLPLRWLSLGDTPEEVERRVRVMRDRRRSTEVWRRLGLSEIQRDALKLYLGINSASTAANIEEIAKREGKRVHTIKNRIDLGMHRLMNPAPQVRPAKVV